MSLDSILNSVDGLLLNVSENINRLLTTLTVFIPIFVVAFVLLVLLLTFVVVLTLVIQCKKYRRIRKLPIRRFESLQSPSKSTPPLAEYIKVEPHESV